MVSFNLLFTWRLGNEQGLRREGGSGKFLLMGGATSRSWPLSFLGKQLLMGP